MCKNYSVCWSDGSLLAPGPGLLRLKERVVDIAELHSSRGPVPCWGAVGASTESRWMERTGHPGWGRVLRAESRGRSGSREGNSPMSGTKAQDQKKGAQPWRLGHMHGQS